MIRKNWRVLNLTNAITDIFLNILAIFLAYNTRFFGMEVSTQYQQANTYYLIAGVIYGVLMAFIYALMRLYEPERNKGYLWEISIVLRANLLGILMLGVGFFLLRLVDFSRLVILFSFLYSSALIIAKHALILLVTRRYRVLGFNKQFTLLVGSGKLAQNYIEAIGVNPQLGFDILGYVNCHPQDTLAELDCLGQIDSLEALLQEHAPDQVVIALSERDVAFTKAAIEVCNQTGTRFAVIPFFSEYIFSAAAPSVDTIGGVQLFDFSASPLDLLGSKAIKRTMDIGASLVMLVVLSPFLLLAAIAVKLSSPGPVFFTQERVGLNKGTFKMIKFRSMRMNAASDEAWSSKGDPRITPIGRFLRASNIDELPQLINVLKGDMSLIGPRPEIPFHVGHFKDEIPYYMVRHQIRPGLTGWAQVNGLRGDTSIEKRVKYDLFYIYNWSLLFDIKILLKTLTSRGG